MLTQRLAHIPVYVYLPSGLLLLLCSLCLSIRPCPPLPHAPFPVDETQNDTMQQVLESSVADSGSTSGPTSAGSSASSTGVGSAYGTESTGDGGSATTSAASYTDTDDADGGVSELCTEFLNVHLLGGNLQSYIGIKEDNPLSYETE